MTSRVALHLQEICSYLLFKRMMRLVLESHFQNEDVIEVPLDARHREHIRPHMSAGLIVAF